MGIPPLVSMHIYIGNLSAYVHFSTVTPRDSTVKDESECLMYLYRGAHSEANKEDSLDAAGREGAGIFASTNGGVVADGGCVILKRGAALHADSR